MNKFLFSLLISLSFHGITTAQTNVPSGPVAASYATLTTKGIDTEVWSFFADEDNQNFYIDFETININLNEVVVKDEQGNIVAKEDVSNLPVNTIYELDCSGYPTGQYIVELHAYTGILRKNFSVK